MPGLLRSPRMLAVKGVGGTRIAAAFHPGSELAVPAVLIHGFGSSAASNWAVTGWLRQLARAGIPAVTVDLRGHGLSDKPHEPESYSLPILVGDVQIVLASMGMVWRSVPEVDLIGYSMGGRLVAELVAACTGSPVSARYWPDHLPKVRRAVIGGYDGRPLFHGLDDAEIAAFGHALTGEPGPESPGRQVARIALAVAGNDLRALAALVRGVSAVQSALEPDRVAVPTLVVAGDRDRVTPNTVGWAAGLPAGRHLSVPGRDHISAVTSALFRTSAIDFLAHDGRSASGPMA